MRVLVACEYSGVVRRAFRELGHDAWSCDLLEAEDEINHHYRLDVSAVLDLGWDLMIAHPPCTHLSVSGARHFAEKRADGRQQEAIDFFLMLANAPIERIAIENPVCIMSSVWREPDQIIQPWEFGHNASKATCLWLKALPPLVPTAHHPGEYECKCGHRFDYSLGAYGCPNCCGESGAAFNVYKNTCRSGQNRLPPSPDRWKERSRTYEGIAKAMAAQWGDFSDLVTQMGGR